MGHDRSGLPEGDRCTGPARSLSHLAGERISGVCGTSQDVKIKDACLEGAVVAINELKLKAEITLTILGSP